MNTTINKSDELLEQSTLEKIDRLLSGKKNATYQFIVIEGLLRGIERTPKENKILVEDIYKEFAIIAYDLRKNRGLDLGGERQSIDGKSSANGIIDRFVEKYDLKDTKQLSNEYIDILRSNLLNSNIKRWPIEGITNEKIGLFSKQNIDGNTFICFKEEVRKILLENKDIVREINDRALNNYLKAVPHNEIEEFIHLNNSDIREVPQREIKKKMIEKIYDTDELVQNIHNYITQKGFSYSIQTIQNLYLSLKTKPFTILAGISGTGKSKIIELFAEAIGATETNGRYKLIAVRPDWSDSTELIGYRDLNNKFNPGILTEVLLKAREDLQQPYFICLDEMNLARVEYYFSDFLSIIESRKWEEGQILTHRLLDQEGYESLGIPENVYLIGTVNMDETTYPFSKKVLDRANTIEFSEVNLMEGLEGLVDAEIAPLEGVSNRYMRSEYLNIADCRAFQEIAVEVTRQLIELNQILQPSHLHFAYRVRDEIVFYMLYNERFNLMSWDQAFELQLLQKILPRISGSSAKIREVLEKLKDYTKDKYPKAYEKVIFMIERYEEDGFTSYWM